MIIDGLKMGGRKPPVQNSSIKKLMSIVQSNTPHANNNISRSKPFQRGISISDHLSNQTPILPIISKKVSQRELQISDSAFEGYKLVSEEMSFEIDEYVRLQNTKLLLPPINWYIIDIISNFFEFSSRRGRLPSWQIRPASSAHH